ncbi:MAG TPA: glutathione-regulated potassium-efflux system protein KefC [Polyangiaceae bacterium]|nr:glutathione-regulated potassium-efflux system protein KefC [Polyangiaceae bacterium]
MSTGGTALSDVLVYLAAATVCVPLASRLKLGSVLGYLAAGCVIGPFGLRLVSDPEATLHFSEIGVVLMLFIIGLELDPRHLWALRRPVFGGGGLQLLGCGLPIFAAAWALGLPWQGALVVGLTLGLSSTAVVLQTMSERNLTQSGMGRLSFSILLFQDIAAIPLLALVPLLAANGAAGTGASWWGAGKVLLALAAVFVIGRFLTRPLLRLLAITGLREVFTAFTLLLVLGVALLMSSVGISMALGAFLAGVLLAGSEYRHALESDIEPFKGLLLGLFFIAVGMSIDFALIRTNPLLVVSLLFGFQALKGLALWLVSFRLGVPAKQRWLFSALLVQGGEFAFVVFGLARNTPLLPGSLDRLLTLTVALSMALTPAWLILHARFLEGEGSQPEQEDDFEDEDAAVIIAGFGRFGQIVGRLLFASGIRATVLDHDPETIEALAHFGFKIHYGDATRLDLLEVAGAARARVLVVALDEQEAALRLVDAAQEHFPRLKIVARARDVGHYQELRRRGVRVVERETFESAVAIGRRTLVELGVGPFDAQERANAFRRHNLTSLEAMLPHWDDVERRRSMAVSAREQFEQQMSQDRVELLRHGYRAWHGDDSDEEERPEDERRAAGS